MKTILFDLDGTLLPMDLKTFEQAYFGGLCKLFTELKPEELVKAVWAGTNAMFENDGSMTNREVFAKVFSQVSGIDFVSNEARLEEYYRTGFQDCKKVCTITNQSRKIIHRLMEKGYQVAIATNPIFPKIATFSRLRWLGILPEELKLVTTYEDFHYAKPNPHYFLEVCSRLDVNPKDCIMVGNDVVEDGCAKKVGIEVMLVTDCLISHGQSADEFWQGSLEDVYDWVEQL